MTCPQCGTALPQNARFCPSCGRGVDDAGATDPLRRLVPPEIAARLLASRRAGSAGERRVVTALFCDVKGSTAAAERLDPEEWTEVMNALFAELIGPVYRYEGVVARLMGDAVLAFFGAPIAHEDDPARAVLAGLDIVAGVARAREPLRRERSVDVDVRVGINTGLAVVGEVGSDLRVEYTAMGDAVNVAARMEQTAAPGTVRIAEDTHRLVAPLFECEPLGAVEVKGKRDPVGAYRVVARAARPGSLRGLPGARGPLVGRERELAALRSALDALSSGRGGVVAVVAEAGLGKSRLLAEARDAWRAPPGRWSESRALAYERDQPYAQIEQHLRALGAAGEGITGLLGVDTSALSGEALKREIARRARERVAAAGRAPLVLAFDDLHWADAASVELLAWLADLGDELPTLFVCAARPEAPEGVRELLARPGVRRVELAPLDAADADALAAALLAGTADEPARRALAARADGNPFFLEELIRARAGAGGDVPETLHGLLLARIDALPDEPRRTLQVASVIGRTFAPDLLAAIAARDGGLDADLAQLEAAALVTRGGDGTFAFRHALTHEAAYASLLRRERRALHARVGEVLERELGARAETEATLLGHHFVEAGDARGVRYERIAGDQAARLYANAEAAAHYRRALDAATPDADGALLLHLYTQLGRALELQARYADAAETYERCERVARERGDRALELAALSAHATLRSFFNPLADVDRAAELLGRADRIAAEIGDRPAQARILWTLMLQLALSGRDPRRAAESGERSAAIARELGLREQLAFTLNDMHHAYLQLGRLADARRATVEARALWEALGNRPMLADSFSAEAISAYLAGEYDLALDLAGRGRSISREIGNRWGEAFSMRTVGPIALERGDVARGIALLHEAIGIAEEGGLVPALVALRAELALLCAQLGDVAAGRELIALARARVGLLPRLVPVLLAHEARVEVRAGDVAAAHAALAAAADANLDDWGIGVQWLPVARAEVRLAEGAAAEAADALSETVSRMRRAGARARSDEVLALQARALRAAGRADEAARAARDALAASDTLRTRWWRWRILADLGRDAEARATLRDVIATVPADLEGGFRRLPEVRALLG